MRNTVVIVSILLGMLIVGCQKGPQPIDFGNQLCDHCKMTISDPKFGAQWVTPTGKTYNYDAVECLLWHLEEEPMEGDAYVIAFDQPTTLIPATSATFLVAKDQPSPMGAFLSAYADNATAIAKAESLSGSWHTWDRLQAGIPNPK